MTDLLARNFKNFMDDIGPLRIHTRGLGQAGLIRGKATGDVTLDDIIACQPSRQLSVGTSIEIALAVGAALKLPQYAESPFHWAGNVIPLTSVIIEEEVARPALRRHFQAYILYIGHPNRINVNSDIAVLKQRKRMQESVVQDSVPIAYLLYEILTGRPPYPLVMSDGRTIMEMTKEPKPISSFRIDVPVDLDNAIFAGLEPNPTFRLPLDELIEALSRYVFSKLQ